MSAKQVEFFWQGVLPTATHQGRRQNNRGGYATDAGRLAKATCRAIFEKHAPESPFRGAVAVSISMTWPHTKVQSNTFAIRKTSKPDLDNVLKFVLDTMTDLGYWEDDKQVCSIEVSKWHGDVPGIYCLVIEKTLVCDSTPASTKAMQRAFLES